MEEDLHMALCVVKVLALVVIASALLSISNSMGSGMMRDGGSFPNTEPGPLGNHVGVQGGPQDFIMASYNVEGDQIAVGSAPNKGGFTDRYEPPVFWNAGDMSVYESAQQGAAAMGVVDSANLGESSPAYAVPVDAAGNVIAAKPAVGYYANKKRGYALNNPHKGYALNPTRGFMGIPSTNGNIHPNYA